MKKLALAFALALTTITAACGSDDSPSSGSSGSSGASTPDGSAPAANTVTVKSNTFAPAQLTVKVGDTVTWVWAGGSHNVVSGANCTEDATPPTFSSGAPTADMSTKFTHTFTKAGSFEYFCTPHCSVGMKGTVVVQ